MIHSVNLDKEADAIWEKRFGKGKVNYRNFSEWVSSKLKELEEEKYDLNTLIQIKEDLKTRVERDSKRMKEIDNKIETAERLEKMKFSINEREASYLNESNELIKMDSSKFYPRMKSYSNLFSKEVNEEEFMKLMEMAEEKYPFTQGYVEQKIPKDLNSCDNSE